MASEEEILVTEETTTETDNRPATHKDPKCTCCGNIGPWEVEGIFRPVHLIIGLFLLLWGVFPGVFYLVTVALIRMKPEHRAKTCPRCKARNMFTYLY